MPLDLVRDTSVDEIDLRQFMRTIWRGKYWIFLCVIIAVLIGGYYAFSGATPLYKSNAMVVLENRQEQVVSLDSVMSGLSGDQATINTEVEVIRSRALIEKLVIEMDLVKDPEFNVRLRPLSQFSLAAVVRFAKDAITSGATEAPPLSDRETLDAVIDLVRDAITVANIRQSFVFQITATSQNPVKSANMANHLANIYILGQLEVKFNATEQATDWLTERVGQLQVELETAETVVKDFVTSTDLIGPETLDALNRQLKELRERRIKAGLRSQEVATQISQMRLAMGKNDLAEVAKISQDQTLIRLGALLAQGQIDKRDAFNARSVLVLDKEKMEKTRADDQVLTLKASIDSLEAQIDSQSNDLVKLQQLQREAEASKLIYEYFLGRLKETSVQQGIQQADSRVLSQAVPRRDATSPKKSLVLVLSMFMGAIIGIGLVLLRELSQNTFRTAEDLESRTGYTVMGQVPIIAGRKRKNVLKYLTDKPTSAAAEAIRNLRTSLLLSNVDKPPQIIMSTSSIPNEGKTTQSISLAQNLSGLGKKVLLIEGDIRRRVFAEYFEISGKKGLLAVLSGEAELPDVVIHNDDLMADILIGEKSAANAADIFSSEKFHDFLADVRKRYDFIIIDTPPVLAVPDARVIGQSVDAILYTVKWDSTSHRQVSEGLRSLESVGANISGLVLAQINSRDMKRYGYGETYGAYSNYYDN